MEPRSSRLGRATALCAGALLWALSTSACGAADSDAPIPRPSDPLISAEVDAPGAETPESPGLGTAEPETPPESPAPPAPELPEEITEFTEEGALAAAQFYLDAFEYGYATLDSAPLEMICHEKSQACQAQIKQISVIKTANQKTMGGSLEVGPLEIVNVGDDDMSIEFSLTQDSLDVVTQDGSIVNSHVAQTGIGRINVLLTDSGWKIRAVANEAFDD